MKNTNSVLEIAKKLYKKFKIKKRKIDYGIVLGSGLSAAYPNLINIKEITYEKLGLGQQAIEGHRGSFIFGEYKGKHIFIASRFHYYEGGDISKVKFPYEIMNYLGVKNVIMASAAGGINQDFNPGEIMIVKGHINLTGFNPLIKFSNVKFVDMSHAYDPDMIDKIRSIAVELNVKVHEGIHLQLAGPSYETPAEIKMAKMFGADSVSYSLAYDCIICRYYGINVLGFSVITNKAAGLSEEILTHEKVLEVSNAASANLKSIITKFIELP